MTSSRTSRFKSDRFSYQVLAWLRHRWIPAFACEIPGIVNQDHVVLDRMSHDDIQFTTTSSSPWPDPHACSRRGSFERGHHPQASKADREEIDLKRHYSIQQVEYCRNLVFRRQFPIHKSFECSCDIGLLRLLPDKISQIFGLRISKRLRGDSRPCCSPSTTATTFSVPCSLLAYVRESFSTFLRLEAFSNNLKDFGFRKSLNNLEAITDRFAALETEALNVHVDFPFFQRLPLPITSNQTRVPGIKIQDIRILGLMEVLLHNGTNLGGYRTAQWKVSALR